MAAPIGHGGRAPGHRALLWWHQVCCRRRAPRRREMLWTWKYGCISFKLERWSEWFALMDIHWFIGRSKFLTFDKARILRIKRLGLDSNDVFGFSLIESDCATAEVWVGIELDDGHPDMWRFESWGHSAGELQTRGGNLYFLYIYIVYIILHILWLWLNNEVPKHRPSHVYRGLPIIHFEDQTSFGPADLMTIWPKLDHTNTDGSFKFAEKDWDCGVLIFT